MTCMLGPVLITQGLHRPPWMPCSFPPHPLCPFPWGGGKLPWLPRHGPWGGGLVQLHLCCGGRRFRPLRAAPRGMGVGVDRCPLLLPPPPPLGGGPRTRARGSMPSAVADDPARAAVSRREMSPKISASPREGGEMRTRLYPPRPTRVSPSGRPAGAPDACSRSPCSPRAGRAA